MIHPDKIGMEAKKREDENYKFRSFLKGHADEEELALAGIQALEDFIRECGLPGTLRELGVDENTDLREIADSCYTAGGAFREIRQDEIYEIYKECF